MKKFIILTFAILCTTLTLKSQTIKSPSEFLGYELGTRFTRHHQVVNYFNYVSDSSKSVDLKKYGETNENRPLLLSYISSEENIKNLEAIRLDNLKRTGIVEGTPSTSVPIIWLSYNVHGNEASSSEAAMLTLYKLITKKQEWLKTAVIIIDPCLNPDGRDRYVNWYNQYQNTPYNPNPVAYEHHEPWPGGRPNHYLFDLNRDWAWISQVESAQRLAQYNKWMPQIHVDFHEQGYESPYYFAPAAEPFHEVITDWQRDFQTEIGKNHAKYFDKEGWRYFSKERFDLLYPSYGDTYPTYMGAIGMTYEQAGHGMAGLGISLENGQELTLLDRLTHHTVTGLSTIEITIKNADKLIDEYEKFFKVQDTYKTKSYILKNNSKNIKSLLALLDAHEINYYAANNTTVKGFDYNSMESKSVKITEDDIVIPVNQPKGTMVKVLFEQNAALENPLTYDITAWSLPYAYGINCIASTTNPSSNTAYKLEDFTANTSDINAYAYITKWNEVADATFLAELLKNKFNVRFSEVDFEVAGNKYSKGSLIVMRGENTHLTDFDTTIVEIANKNNQLLNSASTGFVNSGSDFGSSNVALIKAKKVALIGGEGTSSLNFGEIWHFFETQLKYPVNVLNTAGLNRINLSDFDVLILPIDYRASKGQLAKITEYVTKGGTVISLGNAANNFADKEGFSLTSKSKEDKEEEKSPNLTPYNKREAEYIKEAITGSIFKSNVDESHPLAFGYTDTYFSLKLGAKNYNLLENGANIAYLPENTKPISGYAGEYALENVPNSLLFGIERKGRGKIVYMVDNPLFRSFWQNGKLFFANAVFLN
ncbi:M14 family metallopeptidase [Lutibacter holmesii]|uniref:M14 family metallopeptidase n=1 Tax=Lutibacter holmesii TaxID=1137985 RepID=A0ABW3WLK5_9FLAO